MCIYLYEHFTQQDQVATNITNCYDFLISSISRLSGTPVAVGAQFTSFLWADDAAELVPKILLIGGRFDMHPILTCVTLQPCEPYLEETGNCYFFGWQSPNLTLRVGCFGYFGK